MTADGTDLIVDERGEGPAVVLVHAGIADRHMWDRELQAWSGRYRVIRYDVRGYGESPDAVEDYWDHEDLLAVLDACGVEQAAVVGASNGGRIALDLAVIHPDRLFALVLVGAGTPGMSWPDELQEVWDAQETAMEEGHYGQVVDIDLQLWLAGVGRTIADVDPALVRRVATWDHANVKREADAGGGTPQRIDPLAKDRLGEITAPTLAVVGAHDQPLMHTVADLMAAGAPGGEKAVIERAAHLPSLECPDVFDDVVLGFLERTLP